MGSRGSPGSWDAIDITSSREGLTVWGQGEWVLFANGSCSDGGTARRPWGPAVGRAERVEKGAMGRQHLWGETLNFLLAALGGLAETA